MATTRKTRKTTTRKTDGPKRDIYQEVTDRMVAQLEQGTAPWRKPWSSRSGRPQNLDGRRYRGVNVLLLGLAALEHGYSSPFWATFNQIKERGGSVKGQKGTLVVLWTTFKVTEVNPNTGKPEVKTVPVLRHYSVFNLDQVDTEGMKLPKRVVEFQTAQANHEHVPVESADDVIAAYIENGPTLRHGGDRAFYVPATDIITVPERTDYANGDEYYSTTFHEMGHSTGHPDRLARKYGETFGNHEYGREELVAEMTSAFLQAETGIESAMDNSAAYLRGWIKTIKEDVRAVVVAAGAAQRAADLILGRTAPQTDEVAEGNDDTPAADETVERAA
jgi:antirestriction protein ArdC